MSRKGSPKKKQDGKKGGGQQKVKKRKHYSPEIPFRKLARALDGCGVNFVAKEAFAATRKTKLGLPEKDREGAMSEQEMVLREMAHNGHWETYGERVVALARQAVEELEKLYGRSPEPEKLAESMDPEMVALELATRPDSK